MESPEIKQKYAGKSQCCNAIAGVAGDLEGNDHYQCTECGNKCDVWSGNQDRV